MRTLAAFLLAPLVAPLIFGTVSAFQPHDGMSALSIFLQAGYLACFLSFGLSYTFGSIIFLILRWRHRESIANYATCGSKGHELHKETIFLALTLGMLGASFSTAFALIRGAQRSLPNHSPDPTPSVTPPAGAGGAPSVAADH
jgi:hypothetical protein